MTRNAEIIKRRAACLVFFGLFTLFIYAVVYLFCQALNVPMVPTYGDHAKRLQWEAKYRAGKFVKEGKCANQQ